MVYLVCSMRPARRARHDQKVLRAWLEERERWSSEGLPIVRGVRLYYSVTGEVYPIRTRPAADDEAGWGAHRAAITGRKSDDSGESRRVSQDDWWEFLGTRLVIDPPVRVGFRRAAS